MGVSSPEARAAFKAAEQRIGATTPGNPRQPARGDAPRRQKTVMIPDMAGLPIAPGGVVQRNEETGRVTIRPVAAPRTCDAGHVAEPDARYCHIDGLPVGTPDEHGAAEDGRPWQDIEAARQREREEIGYEPPLSGRVVP